MKLTKSEFKCIRSTLTWSKQQYGNEIYNVPDSPNLFWIDFMRNIFVFYFRKQQAVTRLMDFDVGQPVLLTDNLELRLPKEMERVVYIAKNQYTPSCLIQSSISQFLVAILAILTYLFLIVWHIYKYGIRKKSETIVETQP